MLVHWNESTSFPVLSSKHLFLGVWNEGITVT